MSSKKKQSKFKRWLAHTAFFKKIAMFITVRQKRKEALLKRENLEFNAQVPEDDDVIDLSNEFDDVFDFDLDEASIREKLSSNIDSMLGRAPLYDRAPNEPQNTQAEPHFIENEAKPYFQGEGKLGGGDEFAKTERVSDVRTISSLLRSEDYEEPELPADYEKDTIFGDEFYRVKRHNQKEKVTKDQRGEKSALYADLSERDLIISRLLKEGRASVSKKKHKIYLKKTKGQKIRKFVICTVLWAVFAFVCYEAFTFAYKILNDTAIDSSNMQKIEVTITGEETDEEMAEKLVKLGLVENERIYVLRCKVFDAAYVAGTYELSPSYDTEKIINILSGLSYSSD